ncbi:MAG: FEKKY domain-containing protein [Planctomycetota bacterium]|jgi:hypothetical protein
MKTKITLAATAVLLLGLLVHAYWRIHKARQQIGWHIRGIRRIAVANAEADLSKNGASYRFLGKVAGNLKPEFDDYFREHNITATLIGCIVTEAEHAYSTEYNRVVREHLTSQHGKDLIEEFHHYYRDKHF